jgi:hypothetical protein
VVQNIRGDKVKVGRVPSELVVEVREYIAVMAKFVDKCWALVETLEVAWCM